VAVLTFGACGGEAEGNAATEAVRDTTGSGVPRVTHLTLAERVPDTLRAELRIGELDGANPYIFGDIRGIEVGDDGTIYVVDEQARELRAFAADGTFRAVLAGAGEGPGEIGRTNGLVRDADGTLWVYDTSEYALQGYAPGGEYLRSEPSPRRARGYVFSGGVDDQGRFWRFDTYREGPYEQPKSGLSEVTADRFMKVYDPATEVLDSVFVGQQTSRSWVIATDNSTAYMGIPFTSASRPVFDPAGGFWEVAVPEYRVVHVDARGDTTRMIAAEMPTIPVTEADRETYLEAWAERWRDEGSEFLRGGAEMWEHVPDEKPQAAGVFLDDRGRPWVRRGSGGDAMTERPVYDVFERDGTWLATVTPDFVPWVPLNPVIRNGHFHAVEKDELEVARVVRAPLPEVLR
jgi:hypothetical protein